ncbi:hypothetical protein BRDID11002_73890 [Bradyrhizobium diazoefficiens]
MKQNIPEEFPTGLMDWSRFVIKGSKMPPRDPDDDEEDEDEEGEEEGTTTNRRSYASRTKTRKVDGSWRTISPMSWDAKDVALLKKTLGPRTECRADRAPSRV